MKKIVWFIVLMSMVIFASTTTAKVIKEYYENGNIKKSTSYRFNQKNGVEKEYYLNGNIMSETEYKNGKIDGFGRIYLINGRIERERSYMNDKLNGVNKIYFKNGNLSFQAYYSDGKITKEVRAFFENGKLKYKAPVSNDEEIFEMYNNNGTLVVKMPFGKYLDEKAKNLNKISKNIESTGEEYFAPCSACHGADGGFPALGKSKIIAGQPADVIYKKFIKYQLGAKDETGNGSLMTGQVAMLTDDQLKQLALYISQL
ncbi:MAG: hypothetical protein PHI02_07730 [Sulfurovaceae bacterium]|nr:hypothetical protein [Sulfurovaceae bacterium]